MSVTAIAEASTIGLWYGSACSIVRNRIERIRSGSLLDLQYQLYDNVGNVKRIVDAHANTQQLLDYDDIDRLTRAQGPGYDALYSYDAHGNRVTNQAATYQYDASLRLRGQNDQAFDYDDNGNVKVVTNPAATYTYTSDNQIASSNVGGVLNPAAAQKSADSSSDLTTWPVTGFLSSAIRRR